MPKIESFSRDNIKQVRADLQAVLDKFASDHGVEIKLGRITYGDLDFRSSIRVFIPTKDAETPMALDFKTKCLKYGLVPDDLGAEFRSGLNNDMHKIVGLKPRNRKYPIITKNLRDGKQYKFPASVVREALGRPDEFAELFSNLR